MKQKKQLSVQLTRGESIAGWIYLPVYLVVLSMVLGVVMMVLGYSLVDEALNARLDLIYGLINFIACIVIFRRFLIRNLANIPKRFGRFVQGVVLGFLFYWIGTILVSYLVTWIDPDLSNANNEAIEAIASVDYRAIFLYTVVLAPLAEETLFRGLIFSSIHTSHRILAYVVSVLAFGAIHVVNYIGMEPVLSLLLSYLEYFPAGIVLCWAYERADSIWAPILIHCSINLISMLSMQLL